MTKTKIGKIHYEKMNNFITGNFIMYLYIRAVINIIIFNLQKLK